MWGALFPGQGSQAVGMGRFLFDEFADARMIFEEAGDTLKQDFKKLCFEGPEADLQLTENTQPALLLVSTATYLVVSSLMPFKARAAAGHSIGEYAALVAAGTLSFTDALRAVRTRGQAMQRAVPVGQGAMCAVLGLSDEAVRKLCTLVEEQSGEKPLEPANFNSPGQVVVSGSAKAVEWLRANVKQEWMLENMASDAGARVKLIPLAVSAPFHCSLMKPAEEEMRDVLTATPFAAPAFAVVQNLTASPSSDVETIRERLIGQISGSVLWTQCQEELMHMEIFNYVEFGAGKVLAGLAKKIASGGAAAENMRVFNMNSLEDLKTLEKALNT
ncbi:MAG: ACP S-malonyltransferase [Bdellovibrionales bacterium]|jgi:[acyl-carrier-protein] S-malonyltransferase|nr:ACP S-malonyltransferase [Bdellovibrionales bacterium]